MYSKIIIPSYSKLKIITVQVTKKMGRSIINKTHLSIFSFLFSYAGFDIIHYFFVDGIKAREISFQRECIIVRRFPDCLE